MLRDLLFIQTIFKASDFIEHGPERVNFGESFRELIDKPFALYALNFEIFFRIYFNQLKYVCDFIVFIYFFGNDTNKNLRFLEKTIFNIYCLHLKKLIREINSIM